MSDYVVRNKDGLWMNTYSDKFGEEAKHLAIQCAKASNGRVIKEDGELRIIIWPKEDSNN